METRKYDMINIISIIIGVVSLFLTIYLTKNMILQIGFAITIILSVIIISLYINHKAIETLNKENKQTSEEVKLMKEKLDIYERLSKIEYKLFHEGTKMNKKGQIEYTVLTILLVLLFLFLIYLTFFK